MRIALSYFDGCPNWQVAYERLAAALEETGYDDVVIDLAPVTSEEQAVEVGFAGSPTILVDDVDPFAEEMPRSGLSCRLYSTPQGMDVAPSIDQLVEALSAAH